MPCFKSHLLYTRFTETCNAHSLVRPLWTFFVHKILLVPHSKTALHSPKQPKLRISFKKKVQVIQCNPSLRKPGDPKLIWKDVIYFTLLILMFTVTTKLTALHGFTRGFNHISSNQFGIALYGAILCFIFFYWHFCFFVFLSILQQVPLVFNHVVMFSRNCHLFWVVKLCNIQNF